MYKIPEQALLKAIEGTDKQIDTENLYVTEAQKLLQKKALNPDEARQLELIKQHQQGIDEVSQMLASSPLAALKDRQKVRDLGKKIYEDVTRGELGAQYRNYDIRQKHYEEELKRATNADGTIRIEDLNEAMAAFDKQFAEERKDEQGNLLHGVGTSYDPITGKYKTYGSEKLVNFYDRKEEFEKIAKDWKPSTDTDIKKEFIQGNYYVTRRDKDELLPLNELTFGIYKTMMYDPKAIEYYKQKARIRSGGNKELFNQEMTRLFGERVDPDNPFSAFKMKEVKDAEGKTKMQKVQKYDKDGNPEMKDGKPVTEEIPMMEMANPGELFMAAQAAADKQDIKKVIREETLDLTEQAQMQIDLAKTKAERDDADARELAKETTLNSNNNAEVIDVVFTQKTNQEAFAAKEALKTNVVANLSKKGTELINIINNSNRPAKEKETLIKQLKDIMNPLQVGAKDLKSLDFSTLKNFVEKNKIVGAGDAGTGVDDLIQNYKQTSIEYANKTQHYDAMRNLSKPKEYDKVVSDTKAAKALYESALASRGRGDQITMQLYEKYNKLQNKQNQLTKNWHTAFDMQLDYNNPNSANRNTGTVYSTGGRELQGILPTSTVKGFNQALKNLTASNLFPHLLGASNAVVVTKGQAEATNFNKLLEKNNINAEVISNMKDGEEIKIEGGKIVTMELGSARVVPGNANFVIANNGVTERRNLGKGSIQVTLKIYNPKTNQTEINEIYIPKNEIGNNDLKTGSDYIERHYEPVDIKNQANKQYGSVRNNKNLSEEKKKEYSFRFDGGNYFPEEDRWEFDGRQQPISGDAGLDMYRNLKGIN